MQSNILTEVELIMFFNIIIIIIIIIIPQVLDVQEWQSRPNYFLLQLYVNTHRIWSDFRREFTIAFVSING